MLKPLRLLHFPVDHTAENAVPPQFLEQYVDHLPGSAEYHASVRIFLNQNVFKPTILFFLQNLIHGLFDCRRRLHLILHGNEHCF